MSFMLFIGPIIGVAVAIIAAAGVLRPLWCSPA